MCSSDLEMPEMDGLTALGSLRTTEIETGDHTPVIAMTAHASAADRRHCLDSGMDGYITKPIDFDILVHTLNEITTKA